MLELLYGWQSGEAPGLTMCDGCKARIMPGIETWGLTITDVVSGIFIGKQVAVIHHIVRAVHGRRCAKCGPPYRVAVLRRAG